MNLMWQVWSNQNDAPWTGNATCSRVKGGIPAYCVSRLLLCERYHDRYSRQPVLHVRHTRHCHFRDSMYCPIRIHTPYTTPETMRSLAMFHILTVF